MSPSGSVLSLVTLGLLLGAACTPSGNVGRTPRAGADSAPDGTEAPVEGPLGAEEATAEPTPEVAPPPRRPVTARPVSVPRFAGPYRVRVVDDNHRDLPTFASEGRTYVMGTVGSRYSIVVANPTARRVEAVLSVDGLDAMDGHPANYVEKRGYILPAYGDVTIDGFRTSVDDVATFRFSSVADSYAGRLGHARDVGVIGVAFFPERAPVTVWQPPSPPPPTYAPRAQAAPRPAPAKPHSSGDESPSAYGESAGAPAAPAPPSAAPASPKSASEDVATESARKRPGLGTEFARANPSRPSQVVSIRYNDRAGLLALGIAIPRPYVAAESDLRLRESADPFRANGFAQPPP